MLSLSRHVIGQVVFAGTLVVAAVVACGGSTSTGIGNPDPAGSSSGTSGTSGTSGASGSSGQNSATAACPEIGCGPGTVSRTHEGQCCPSCDPIPNQCDGKADSCSNKKGCAEPEYERFEYAPGCCECRLAKCKGVTCPPFQSCGLGEHADLSGCCGVCVKDDVCKNGATPCSTYQCPVGYKAQGSPSSDGPNCCSSCEVDPAYCAAERNANATFITTRLSDPAALKCITKEDCVVANLTNACNGDCGHAVAKAQASQITNDVTTYGQTHCSQCPPQLVGCPAVVLVARCGNDQKCTLSPN